MSSLSNTQYAAGDHSFIPATTSDRRSPCPALNTLANHGYIPRSGTGIRFWDVLQAVKNVYNLSFPLAFLLTLAGYATCATFSLKHVSWTLDLADLSVRGWDKIAHDASLVHPSGIPSHTPDPALLENLLSAADHPGPQVETGMTLEGLAAVHAERKRSLPRPLSGFHDQIALGECALGWLVMRNVQTGVVELDTLAQWFGEERLPKGWWEKFRRPRSPVGLWQARSVAGQAQKFISQCSAQ
ncbi:Chloroperoxidase [Mycena rosella]|uniref:Chloroperoxidase n=1 Tax=Mycena rosella TaxID=1033263 RepID=A0AAD7G4Q3_MYCRO|nr:Chloroperoxidase [Mycena rosella]